MQYVDFWEHLWILDRKYMDFRKKLVATLVGSDSSAVCRFNMMPVSSNDIQFTRYENEIY